MFHMIKSVFQRLYSIGLDFIESEIVIDDQVEARDLDEGEK